MNPDELCPERAFFYLHQLLFTPQWDWGLIDRTNIRMPFLWSPEKVIILEVGEFRLIQTINGCGQCGKNNMKKNSLQLLLEAKKRLHFIFLWVVSVCY